MFWGKNQNIDPCVHVRGGSNEYPQPMFWSKNKKNRYTPAYASFAICELSRKYENTLKSMEYQTFLSLRLTYYCKFSII